MRVGQQVHAAVLDRAIQRWPLVSTYMDAAALLKYSSRSSSSGGSDSGGYGRFNVGTAKKYHYSWPEVWDYMIAVFGSIRGQLIASKTEKTALATTADALVKVIDDILEHDMVPSLKNMLGRHSAALPVMALAPGGSRPSGTTPSSRSTRPLQRNDSRGRRARARRRRGGRQAARGRPARRARRLRSRRVGWRKASGPRHLGVPSGSAGAPRAVTP